MRISYSLPDLSSSLLQAVLLTWPSQRLTMNTDSDLWLYQVAAGLFTAGITMFSGSIYLLVLDPQRFKALGPVTPIGGAALIAGWVALAVGSRGRFAGL